MFRYRYIQTDYTQENLHAYINLLPQGYQVFGEGIDLRGWLVATENKVNYLKVLLYSNQKREFLQLAKFRPSPDVQELFPNLQGSDEARFSFSLGKQTLPEINTGSDFALEFVVGMGEQEFIFKTIVFVRDEMTTDAIFVIGSPRSGTSILGNSLSRLLMGNHGYGESHVLALAQELGNNIESYYQGTPASHLSNNMLNEYNRLLLRAQVHNVFKQHYASLSQTGVFVDKTPGLPMLNALPTIIQIWPQASIIFAKRRAIENVASRIRKFPNVGFENHCQQWSRIMTGWSDLKEVLPRYIEVDQYDIQQQPDRVAEALTHFLNLDKTQERVLKESFIRDRPELTSQLGEMMAMSLRDMSWTKEQKAAFKKICMPVMKAFGYSRGKDYYQAEQV